VTAIRAAQLGLSVACIDEWKGADGKPALGGTCTNVGCIPSKAVLQSSENFEQAGHGFAEHGVKVKGLELDLAQMLKRKDQVVKQNNDGIAYLFKKNKVAFFHGRGSFAGAGGGGHYIAVGGESLNARHVVVATGSSAPGVNSVNWSQQYRRHRRQVQARHHRGGGDRAGTGQRVAAPRGAGHDPRGAAVLPRGRRRADREGGRQGLRQTGAGDPARSEDFEGLFVKENRYCSIYCIR
jgi:hypothetical protein